MGRVKLAESKQQIAARVAPRIKQAIVMLAQQGRHTESQAIEILLEESPRLKAQLAANNGAARKRTATIA